MIIIASHIKPWAKSDKYEKLNLANGLLLCPNHDKLFDNGYITFDNNGELIISQQISKTIQTFMNIHKNMTIEINEENAEFMRYHRKYIFKDDI